MGSFRKILVSMILFLSVNSAYVMADGDSANGIRFGSLDQPPYGFITNDGQHKGYLFDIANMALDEAGFDTHNLILPPKRLLRDMSIDMMDCTFVAKTPYILERFSFIESLGKNLEASVIPKKGLKLESYDDLYGIKIAVPRGVFADPRFDADDKITKIATNDYLENVRLISRGRVDAMLGATDSLIFNLLELGLNPVDVIGEPYVFFSLPVGLVCRNELKEDPRVLRLQKAVIKLREENRIDPVVAKYIQKYNF